MSYVAGKAPALAQAEGIHRCLAAGVDYRVDLLASAAGRNFVVLLAEPAACTEQCALDHGHGHSGLSGDFRIREALQLAQDHDLVLPLREAAECPVEDGELLAPLEGGIGAGVGRGELFPAALLDRHLPSPLNASQLIDAGVLCDLVDPGFEGDRAVARAHPAQGRYEDVLDYVLGAAVVPDDAQHIREDAPAVALIELSEGALVPASGSFD